MTGGGYREHRVSMGDGLGLYARDYGPRDKPAVLCLAGLTRNSKDFDHVARRLAGPYRVICPDYRGRGRSAYDGDWRNYQPRTYLDDVRHLTVALGIHRFAVIGTSLGGILGMALGASQPMSLAGVLLNDVGPDIDQAGLANIVAYVRRIRRMQRLPDWQAAADTLRRTFPELPATTDEEWLVVARSTYVEEPDGSVRPDWDPEIARPFESAGPPPSLWPQFRSLGRLPVAVVRGARSSILTAGTVSEMQDQHPDLECAVIDGVGHAPSLGEPKAEAAIDRFLARCFGPSP